MKALAALMLLALVLVPSAAVLAQDGEQILIIPHLQDEITVTTQAELILASGWGACTPGLVMAWINTAEYRWYLNDALVLTPEQADAYWGPVEFRGPNPYCVIGTGNLWGSSWRYSIGSLPVGTYVVTLVWQLDHKMIDGGDSDGDGQMDFFTGERLHDVTIHVIAP